MPVYQVIVKEKMIQQDMYYKNQIIMKYTIKYPQFISAHFQVFLDKLNSFYRTRAVMYERSNIMNLYQMAMVEYEYSIANNFPVRQFEAYVDYQVTYNQNCALSLYFDQYEYAGGAHGLTIRYSDSWNLQKSKKIEMMDLYPHRNNLKEVLAGIIIGQIDAGYNPEESVFFSDYGKLVQDTIKINNFYLIPEGVVIYFQEYDIAPYSTGIPTFIIPFSVGGPIAPKC